MANICNFSMKCNGEYENIIKFANQLQHKDGNIKIARGADILDFNHEYDNTYYIIGTTKWSVKSSLIKDTISLKNFQLSDNGVETYDDIPWSGVKKSDVYLSIIDAANMLNISVELFSSEEGCGIEEHLVVIPSENIVEYEIIENCYRCSAEDLYELCFRNAIDTEFIDSDAIIKIQKAIKSEYPLLIIPDKEIVHLLHGYTTEFKMGGFPEDENGYFYDAF